MLSERYSWFFEFINSRTASTSLVQRCCGHPLKTAECRVLMSQIRRSYLVLEAVSRLPCRGPSHTSYHRAQATITHKLPSRTNTGCVCRQNLHAANVAADTHASTAAQLACARRLHRGPGYPCHLRHGRTTLACKRGYRPSFTHPPTHSLSPSLDSSQ